MTRLVWPGPRAPHAYPLLLSWPVHSQHPVGSVVMLRLRRASSALLSLCSGFGMARC